MKNQAFSRTKDMASTYASLFAVPVHTPTVHGNQYCHTKKDSANCPMDVCGQCIFLFYEQ